MSELSARMRASGVGVRLDSGELVNILLFSDDIILISNTPESLEELKTILETWCLNFKMRISIGIKVISSFTELICSIQDSDTLEEEVVGHVTNYKYLGIQQYSSSWRTSHRKGQDMVNKAKMYKNVILRMTHYLLDNIFSVSAVWQNIAIPGILYATDAIPISKLVVDELEVLQNQVGKALLGVPQSTANTVVQVELGWKPIKLLIELNKLRFLQRVMADDFVGSQLLKACMNWNLADNNSFYTKNLMTFLSQYGTCPHDLMMVSKKKLHQSYELNCLSQIQELNFYVSPGSGGPFRNM